MPDICMCAGTGCPMKDSCYRHTAKPTTYKDKNGKTQEYQTYFVTPPVKLPVLDDTTLEGKRAGCSHYYP